MLLRLILLIATGFITSKPMTCIITSVCCLLLMSMRKHDITAHQSNRRIFHEHSRSIAITYNPTRIGLSIRSPCKYQLIFFSFFKRPHNRLIIRYVIPVCKLSSRRCNSFNRRIFSHFRLFHSVYTQNFFITDQRIIHQFIYIRISILSYCDLQSNICFVFKLFRNKICVFCRLRYRCVIFTVCTLHPLIYNFSGIICFLEGYVFRRPVC